MAWTIESRGRRRGPRLLAALACALALTACSDDATGDSQSRETPAAPTTVTLPSAPPGTASIGAVEAAVLHQYRGFWKALPEASRMQEEPRIQVLKRYLVSPALGTVTRTLAAQDAFGKGLYGENVPRPEIVNLHTRTASIRDCQDSSRAGVEERKTGRKLTVGVARNPVTATLKRGDDEIWRIATIEYPGGSC